MCDKAVRDYLFPLQFVPDWFVTQQQTDIWYDNDDWHDDNEIIEWYKGYQKRRTQKAQIEKELMLIAWHPSRWWDWCMSEDEKKRNRKIVEVTDSCFLKNYLMRKSARNDQNLKRFS